MVFGFVYLNAQKHGVIDDSTRQNLLNKGRALVPVSFAGLLGFIGLTLLLHRRLTEPRIRATSKTSDIVIAVLLALAAASFRRRMPAWTMFPIAILVGFQLLAITTIPQGDCGSTSDTMTAIAMWIDAPCGLYGVFRLLSRPNA